MIVSENFSNIKLWPLLVIILALFVGYIFGKSNHIEKSEVSKPASKPEECTDVKPGNTGKVVSEKETDTTKKEDPES